VEEYVQGEQLCQYDPVFKLHVISKAQQLLNEIILLMVNMDKQPNLILENRWTAWTKIFQKVKLKHTSPMERLIPKLWTNCKETENRYIMNSAKQP